MTDGNNRDFRRNSIESGKPRGVYEMTELTSVLSFAVDKEE